MFVENGKVAAQKVRAPQARIIYVTQRVTRPYLGKPMGIRFRLLRSALKPFSFVALTRFGGRFNPFFTALQAYRETLSPSLSSPRKQA